MCPHDVFNLFTRSQKEASICVSTDSSKMDIEDAKIICLVSLFVSTFLFGALPYFVITGGSCHGPNAIKIREKVISYLKCFGGGVFMGACLINMLPEGMHQMEEYFLLIDMKVDFPVFSLIVALGFFIIALVELVTHAVIHKSSDHHDHHDHQGLHNHQETDHNAGRASFPNGNRKEMGDNPTPTRSEGGDLTVFRSNSVEMKEFYQRQQSQIGLVEGESSYVPKSSPPIHHGDDSGHDEVEDIMTALDGNPLRAFLLLAALSFHTIFDGLAVGLKSTVTDVWQLFIAIAIHKSLVSICLGLQLFLVYKDKALKGFLWTAFFSAIAPIGVGAGMLLMSGDIDAAGKQLTNTFLQGLATGTFLYVTFFEILKEELVDQKSFIRLFIVALGFGAMSLIKYFTDEGH